MGRFAYVGVAVAASLALTGCYSVPQPVCGFFCGSAGECPTDYTCSTADNRCHLNGSPAQLCPTNDAGAGDTADAPRDVAVDGNAAPEIVDLSPAPNATGVGVSSGATVTFSEDVVGVNASTFLLRVGTTDVPATVAYNGFARLATLAPLQQLAANTTYRATITSGITDLGGLPLATTSWNFTTGNDTVGPHVVQWSPAQGDTLVPVTSTVSVQFDEPVTGVSPTTFTLQNGATPISGTTTYTPGTRTARFTPDAQLPGGAVLTATLASGIADAAANPLASAPVAWAFSTDADTVVPHLVSSTPANGSTAIAPTTPITVVFDEPLQNVTLASFTVTDGAAVTGTLASTLGGRAWAFTPAAALASGATVTVVLSTVITDAAGNALPAPVTIAFTTQ